MADQNKDGKQPISSGIQPGPGEHLQGATSPTAGAMGNTGNTGGMGSGSSAAGSGGGSGKSFSATNLKESGARISAEAKQYAGDMANRVKESGRSMFEQQKETAVGQVENVANAIRTTATHLQEEGQDQVARYIGVVADQLESFSGRLREKNLDSIISDTQNLARRSPGTFFVGTVVTGFLLARFLKSSSERRNARMEMSDNEWRTSRPAGGASSPSTMSSGSRPAGVAGASASGDLRTAGVGSSMTSPSGVGTGGGTL
jgi:hypothetical protein